MSIISQFSGGGVKSVQSGTASVAGTTTIISVDVTKSVVYSVSKGSTVTNGNVTLTPNAAVIYSTTGQVARGSYGGSADSGTLYSGTTTMPAYTAAAIAPNSVTARQFSAKLTNATTITVDGACEWQVVEYY
jgi:hypothetical protein